MVQPRSLCSSETFTGTSSSFCGSSIELWFALICYNQLWSKFVSAIMKTWGIQFPLNVCLPRRKTLFWWISELGLSFSSVQLLSCVWLFGPHESQHARPPCPSPTPRVYPNSCPSCQWCHPAISSSVIPFSSCPSSVIPFSSCPQSLPASGSFPMSQLFAWGGQSIGVSALASVLPMNT